MILGLFDKRIEGDDCLLELARLRFQQAGLGAEMHPNTPEQLEWTLRFCPSPHAPVVVHLARDLNLADTSSRQRILEFASRFAGRVHGLVLHDHPDLAARPEDFVRAAWELEARLVTIERSPMVFVEFAAGLEPRAFASFFASIRELTRVSACIDIGHVGIWQARQAYRQLHPGEDICTLKHQPARLPQVMADVEQAVSSALPVVLDLIESLGALGKPVHFHLHDGHPLSTFSPFGVSDHLSFLTEIPLGFEHRGRRSASLMFGPAGLRRIATRALQAIGAERLSFTLEIHPTNDRLPLGDAAPLFAHWRDKTNAETMNRWLAVIGENHRLLQAALTAAQGELDRARSIS